MRDLDLPGFARRWCLVEGLSGRYPVIVEGLVEALGLLFLVGFGVYALISHWSSPRVVTRRAIRHARLTTVAEFPEGAPAKLIGVVRPVGETLQAPLTGRPCAFYEVTVEERSGSSDASYWETLIEERQGVPFVLDDGTGTALIDPHGAQISLVVDTQTRSGTLDDARPVEEQFLRRHGHQSRGLIFNRALRYREAILAPGEVAAVVGHGVREPDPDASAARGYREGPPMRLRMHGSERVQLLVSDDPAAFGPVTPRTPEPRP